MRRAITLLAATIATTGWAQNRFPKPDFTSGYQYPDIRHAIPNENLWIVIDIVLLVLMMGIVSWAALRKFDRKPILWVSIISVAYFGFFRSGCVCSIGSVQNVALALVDKTYIMPLAVFLFFILPVLFAFLFGRVFCAGVCPFGALQELVNLKNCHIPRALTAVLGMIPWIYLAFALLYALTRSTFLICRFDPFVGIFRLGGDIGMLIFGTLLLIAAIFTGRPFCRFLCPYGALLSLFSRVSIFKVRITPKECINCDLCRNACPLDVIKPPYNNKVKESRLRGVKRIINYFIVLPLIIAAGALLFRSLSTELSGLNKDVRLYNLVIQSELTHSTPLPLEVETFYAQGGAIEEITARYEAVQEDFKLYSPFAGGIIGLVIGLTLISLSLKRTRKEYEIDHAGCVACGRCFKYCPQVRLT